MFKAFLTLMCYKMQLAPFLLLEYNLDGLSGVLEI